MDREVSVKSSDYILNWWELDDDLILHLEKKTLEYLRLFIENKFGSLYLLSLKFKMPVSTFYAKLLHKNQGITARVLKMLLNELNMEYNTIDSIDAIGKFKGIKKMKFPIKIKPIWGELLAHGIFDGYVSSSQIRYSNYDPTIRKEFVDLLNELPFQVHYNFPIKVTRDIDVNDVVAKLLMQIFEIYNFYSKKALLSEKFFKMVKKNNLFGWYFLKGAFLDEGTITGGQIFIVRGIANERLAKQMVQLCEILNLNSFIRIHENKYYSVGIYSESFNVFYEKIKFISLNEYTKLNLLNEFIFRHNTPLKRDSFGRFISRGFYGR